MYNSLQIIFYLINLFTDLRYRPVFRSTSTTISTATMVIVRIYTPVLQSNFSLLSDSFLKVSHFFTNRLLALVESLFRLSASGQISSAISENSILLILHCIANITLLLLRITVWDLNFFNIAQFFRSVVKVCSNFLTFCFSVSLVCYYPLELVQIRNYSDKIHPSRASVSVI